MNKLTCALFVAWLLVVGVGCRKDDPAASVAVTDTESEGIPPELQQRIDTLDGERIDAIAIAPNRTWVLIANGRVYTSNPTPSESLVAWLEARLASGQTIGAIAFGPDRDATLGNRWIAAARGPTAFGAATNDGAYFDRKGLLTRVQATASQGIQSIGIDTNQGWVLVSDGHFETSDVRQLPDDLVNVLNDVGPVQRRVLRYVALAYGKWYVVADNWGATNVASQWAKNVRVNAAAGAKIDRVVFGPDTLALARFHGTYREDPFDDFDAVDGSGIVDTRSIDEMLDAAGVPGLTFAVYKDGRLVVAREYGYLVNSGFDRATIRSAWPIASVSKSLTGYVAASASLDSERPFDLYRTVDDARDDDRGRPFDVWASATANSGSITPVQLFSHTAGLNTGGYGGTGPYPASYSTTLDNILKGDFSRYRPRLSGGGVDFAGEMNAGGPVDFLPPRIGAGDGWWYSGGGFQVGQAWLEAETGRSLQDLAKGFVFRPLRMWGTTYDGQPVAAGDEPLAVCHDVADPRMRTSNGTQRQAECPRGYNIAQGAGGAISNAAELGRFAAALANYGRVWIPEGSYQFSGSGPGEMKQALDNVAIQRQLTPRSPPRTDPAGQWIRCNADADCSSNHPTGACASYPGIGGDFCTDLPREIIEVRRDVFTATGPGKNYGLGMYLSTAGRGTPGRLGRPARFFHGGDGYGLHTRIEGYANGWAVAILTNGENRDAVAPSDDFRSRIIRRLGQILGFGSDCDEYLGAEVRCNGNVTSWWGRGTQLGDGGVPPDATSDDAGAPLVDATVSDAGEPLVDATVSDAGAPLVDAMMSDAGAPLVDAMMSDARTGSDGGDPCSDTVTVGALEWTSFIAPQLMSQTAASAYCDALSLGGGWRLPTPDELLLLCFAKRTLPACVQGLDSGRYWSSYVDTFEPVFGSTLSFESSGFDCTRYAVDRSASYRVRCVRRRQP